VRAWPGGFSRRASLLVRGVGRDARQDARQRPSIYRSHRSTVPVPSITQLMFPICGAELPKPRCDCLWRCRLKRSAWWDRRQAHGRCGPYPAHRPGAGPAIAGRRPARVWTGLSRSAAIVDLPGGDPGKTNMRPLVAPDRSIVVPDPDRRAGEGLSGGNGGHGEEKGDDGRGARATARTLACQPFMAEPGEKGDRRKDVMPGRGRLLAGGITRSHQGAILGPAVGLPRSTRKGSGRCATAFWPASKK
jgi:hypothetical protein